jgi:hypothetical protein
MHFGGGRKLARVDCALVPLYTVAVQIVNRAKLSRAAQAELERELPDFGTLQQFVVWGTKQQPPVFLLETIALDEYTHEVIAAWRDGLFLAFFST